MNTTDYLKLDFERHLKTVYPRELDRIETTRILVGFPLGLSPNMYGEGPIWIRAWLRKLPLGGQAYMETFSGMEGNP